MALKSKLDSLESVDEALRPLYVERDGAFHLDVEGDEKSKVAEFRANNIALAKQRDALAARVAELEAAPKPTPVDPAKPVDDDRIAALVKQVDGLTKQLQTESETARKAKLESIETRHFDEVRRAALGAGVEPELVEDFIVARIRPVYRLDDKAEKFVPLNPADRDAVLYGDEHASRTATPEQLVKAVLGDKSAARYLRPTNGPDLPGVRTSAAAGAREVKASDMDGMKRNFDAIAAGTVAVVQ